MKMRWLRGISPGRLIVVAAITVLLYGCNEAAFTEGAIDRTKLNQSSDAIVEPDEPEDLVVGAAGEEPVPEVVEEVEESPPPPVDEDRFKDEIQPERGQSVTIDTFLFPEIYLVHKLIENPDETIKSQETEQPDLTPKYFTQTVTDQTDHNRAIQKTAPIGITDQHVNDWVAKPLDIYVTVDDSESFSNDSIARTKRALEQLVEQIFDTDWRLFLGGLEGVSGNFDRHRINKPATLVDAKAQVNEKLDAIFAEGALGDERVFRSLHKLQYNYRGQDRNNAVHAYLVVSDAPNCKDRNNAESGTCRRQANRDDHHDFIFNKNAYLPAEMKHMALMGAYYRMSNDTGTCGNSDQVEVPLAAEDLKLDSQYAELSFMYEQYLFGVSDAASPSWVGDLCQTSESLTWLTAFADAIKNVAAKRFRTSAVDEAFTAPDDDLNFEIEVAGSGVTVEPSQYDRPTPRIVVLNDAFSSDVVAIYHQANNFRRTSYPNILNPAPEPGSLSISWNASRVDCVHANSFAQVPGSIKCRHWSDDLFLRDVDFLPAMMPGDNPITLNVRWRSQIVEVTELVFTAGSAIFSDTVAFADYPPEAQELVDSATLAFESNDKRLRVTFDSALPVGTYKLSYSELDQSKMTVNLAGAAVGGANAVVCYLAEMAPVINETAPGQLAVDPLEAEFPCRYNVNANSVSFEGRVPVDPVAGKRLLKISYLGYIESMNSIPLDYPVFDQEVLVERYPLDDPMAAASLVEGEDFEITANILDLTADLAPGEGMSVDYEFAQPLTQCFLLTSEVLDGHEYFFWYGPPGGEDPYDRELMEVTEAELENGAMAIEVCLPEDALDYNHRLVVGYISAERDLTQ